MSNNDPAGRREDTAAAQQRQTLDYLKGAAQLPMGWPAVPPNSTYVDPAEIERILQENPEESLTVGKPWLKMRNLIVGTILFAVLLGAIVALI